MIRIKWSYAGAALLAAGVLFVSPPGAIADVVHADDVIIEGSVCVSDDNACANGESFPGNADIKIKDALPYILFEDTSASSSPDRHYRIAIGGAGTTAAEYFAIEDAGASGTSTTQVFRVDGGAPANALRVDSSGDLGIGTATPARELHVADSDTPALRLEQDGSGIFAAQAWDILGSELGFRVRDVTNGNQTPFFIEDNSPTNSVYIEDTGEIGFGTSSPGQALHILRSAGGAIGDNVGFRLENSTTGSQWEFTGVEGNTDHFIINKLGSGQQEMRLNEAGDMTIAGKIITGGPSCGGGCDAVFSPGFAIESVEEHAAEMWAKSHLPAVGPTTEGEAINLPEKVGGLINELEKAHIYIERLTEQLKQEHKRNDELEARLAGLEAAVRATATNN